MRLRFVQHEESLHLSHAHFLVSVQNNLCKITGFLHRESWVEPLKHELQLVSGGMTYQYFHVHTTRPDQCWV